MIPKIKDPKLFRLFHDFLTSYLPVVRKLSPHTVAAYRDTINLYITFICESKQKRMVDIVSEDFDKDSIIDFLEWLKSERKNEVTTINQRLSHVKGFCRYATKNDILSSVAFEDIKEISEEKDTRVPDFVWMSIDEVKLMIEQPNTDKKTGVRDRFFLALLYESGCRDDEMLHLKKNDFLVKSSGDVELHIFGKGSKYRCVPISKDILPYYEEYCKLYHPNSDKEQNELMFYTVRNGVKTQMSPDNVQRFLKTYENSARKVKSDLPHQHPHLWRRTRAMHLYLAGVPLPLVSEWLGHSDIVTTRVYARATDEMKRDVHQKLNQTMGAVFDENEVFKYANDEEILKKLSGLK